MKYKILIVDDIELNLKFLQMLLAEDYEIIAESKATNVMELAKKVQPDLILLDVIMPEKNGFEVCSMLKQDRLTKQIPVIFVTSQSSEEFIVKGYEIGAVDYVTKPYKVLELRAKIKTHLKIKSLISKLEYMATHDMMTGIFNRREFFRLAKENFERNRDNLFVVMIDIDNFKKINDNFGHSVGDKVIKQFANIVRDNIECHSIFGRIGGEEFGLICYAQSQEIVQQRLENIRQIIEKNTIISKDKEVKFTVSIGFVKVTDEYQNIDEALKAADQNLYKAKDNGKNRIVFRER